MASAFAHAIASVAIGKLVKLSPKLQNVLKGIDWKFWLLGAFCAAIPDADSIGYFMGVPYESVWGHRGITHSLFFAALLALVVMFTCYRNEKLNTPKGFLLFLFFFLSTASHPVLDAMTSGGLGVAFFAPFDNTRYFFPFRPIKVSPISISRFFGERGWAVIKNEFVWVWIPSLAIAGLCSLLQPKSKN